MINKPLTSSYILLIGLLMSKIETVLDTVYEIFASTNIVYDCDI